MSNPDNNSAFGNSIQQRYTTRAHMAMGQNHLGNGGTQTVAHLGQILDSGAHLGTSWPSLWRTSATPGQTLALCTSPAHLWIILGTLALGENFGRIWFGEWGRHYLCLLDRAVQWPEGASRILLGAKLFQALFKKMISSSILKNLVWLSHRTNVAITERLSFAVSF